MSEIGRVIAGKYEILKEIGRGGMSVVYLAMDQRLKKTWAVKKINLEDGDRRGFRVNSLLVEANLMKRLDHSALPRIVDIIKQEGAIYVVMDYIEGESLDKVVAAQGPQPEKEVIAWAKQLCQVLFYLHSQQPPIVYRDMKPANVMLRPEGQIKIIDFGIAREYKEQQLTDTTILGTKGYAPPEQYCGQTDRRSDIFALGMTLHHLLTGVDPRGGTPHVPVRTLQPELSETIEYIVERCVRPAAEERYQSCTELLYDLEHPELINKDYKRKRLLRLRLFAASSILCLSFLLSGFTCAFVASRQNQQRYDSLVSVVTATPFAEKIRSYKQAVELAPANPRAYIKMLEAYEDNGQFGQAENNEFLAQFNRYKERIDQRSAAAAELNYRIGLMYFNYYSEGQEAVNFAARVQKAYPFFAANHESGALSDSVEAQVLSECYFLICSFYKNYILSQATVAEASRSDYTALFAAIHQTLDVIGGAGAYDQLSFYHGVFMLLYDQRAALAAMQEEQTEVQDLLFKVYERAQKLVVHKEQSKRLRQEILAHFPNYAEAIARAYAHAEVTDG